MKDPKYSSYSQGDAVADSTAVEKQSGGEAKQNKVEDHKITTKDRITKYKSGFHRKLAK